MDGPTVISDNLNQDQSYQFKSSVKTIGGDFGITDNEGLSAVLMPNLTLACDMGITDNPDLGEIQLPGLQHLAALYFARNGRETSVNLSSLETIGVLEHLTDISGAAESVSFCLWENLVGLYLPSLRAVNETLRINNNLFAELDFPELEWVYQVGITSEFEISGNTFLNQLTLPKLNATWGLSITDNPRLTNLLLNNLTYVRTYLTISGAFTNVELFGLEYVGGDLLIQGGDEMDCSWFDENLVSKVQGSYQCVGNHTKPATPRGPSTTTTELPGMETGATNSTDSPAIEETSGSTSSGDAGGMSTAAKAGVGVGASIGGLALLGGLAFLLMKRRKRRAVLDPPEIPEGPPEMEGDVKDKPPAAPAYQTPEMEGFAPTKIPEMDGARDASEMPAGEKKDVPELPVERMNGRSELA
ncbi:hypothetical protein ABW19_dt0200145 [Dactylella cylindrospora]|nr:hypothetical protein ABW19_dt0200145 [Dactylella cylindrospora]